MPASRIKFEPEQAKHLASLVIKLRKLEKNSGKGPLAERAINAVKADAGAGLALACAGAVEELKLIAANDTGSELTLVERGAVSEQTRSEEEITREKENIIKEINTMLANLNNPDLNVLMGFDDLDKRSE